jgi:hypothetical protein
MRERLAKRYRYLMTGELFNMIFVPSVYFFYLAQGGWQWEAWILRGYGALAIVIILAQGALLWAYKLRTLGQRNPAAEGRVAQWLKRARGFNWVMLALSIPFAILVHLTVGLTLADVVWGILLVGFALLEQISYFYYQLMYDNPADIQYLLTHKRLKEGFVRRELAR